MLAMQRSRTIASAWRHWDVALFLLGAAGVLLALTFGYGYLVGNKSWWPYRHVRAVEHAVKEIRADVRSWSRGGAPYTRRTSRTEGGVITYDPVLAFDGYTFVTAYRNGRFGMSLIDMQGNTVHSWDKAISELYPDGPPPFLDELPADADANIQGSVLLPNGDVVFNLYNTGTVRLDRCSNVVWLLAEPTHHSVELTWDGNFIISAHADKGYEWVPERYRLDPAPDRGFYYNQTVLIVSPEGRVIRSIPLLDSIHRSGYEALLVAGSAGGELFENRINFVDPLHLNDAEMLSPAMADKFPLFEAGDIMVSVRRPSFILVLDGKTGDVKWATAGQFHMQHDPDFLPNGNILIYDNRVTVDDTGRRGGPLPGSSRIIEMDPVSQKIVWSYDGAAEQKFYAHRRGLADRLPNGNVLAVDPEEGRVFEVAPGAGDEIVWDYVNLIEPGSTGQLIDARRYPADGLDFLGKSCPELISRQIER
jgi:hypothetical protein